MKITKTELKSIINECINEVVNEEARMAASDLDSIIHHANELKQLNAITDDANVEDWIKAKLTIAKENITAVFNYYNHDTAGQSPDSTDAGEEPVSAIKPVGATDDAGEDSEQEVEPIAEGSKCSCGSGLDSKWEFDARGIPLCKACSKCRKEKLKGYRKDVLDNPKYDADEPIEPDDMEEGQACGEGCTCKKCGSTTEAKKTKKWIQKAVDPKHKGYCTPMTKPTCTPRRKALAKRFKKGI